MALSLASSPSSTTTEQLFWQPGALYFRGGYYAFDGGTTRELEGTFYFDASDVLLYPLDQIQQQNFYLRYHDIFAGNPLTIRKFELVDPASGAILASAANLPKIVDAQQGSLILGNAITPPAPAPVPTVDSQAPTAPTGVTTLLAAAGKGRKATTAVKVQWGAATDNVGVAKYVIYRNGIKLSETTSLSYSDGTTAAGNSYTYQVTAVDAQGNESLKSNSVTINR
jgi:hypothetical protein